MKKIKIWLKNKLIRYLGIDTLDTNMKELEYKLILNETENSMTFNNIQDRISNVRTSLKSDISHFQDSVNTLHKTIENVVHIGTDVVRPNSGHSWAVVCIEGKMNIVKFIDLHGKDAREILDFLKHFEAGRHCVDAPYKEMFYNGLFKF